MKKITCQRLKNIAFFYLERYDASSQKLRAVLKRRLIKAEREQEVPPEAIEWIEEIVSEMQRLGYVDDQRFTENTVRRLSEIGKSRSFIRTKLQQSGIKEEMILDALSETDELEQARLTVRKKHLGADFKKDLARLARAGFSYEIAKEALEELQRGTTE
ncbi:MAG: RecX family transcriptional regulator [Alphaproteobacteria bacterium]|nr:RecX family transcriptional regulator [Alphaproteobacteria bacterium]